MLEEVLVSSMVKGSPLGLHSTVQHFQYRETCNVSPLAGQLWPLEKPYANFTEKPK